jgi:polysaccharide export outer membrane protein
MRASALLLFASLCAAPTLAACGSLPGGGPTLDAMKEGDVDVIKVTPQMAAAESEAIDEREAADIQHVIEQLRAPQTPSSNLIGPGAKMNVTLWSYSARLSSTGPTSLALGNATVIADGTISLPYAGRIAVNGLTPEQAGEKIARRMEELGLFQQPSIAIEMIFAPRGQVLVTGAVGEPKAISWPAQGLTLANAVSESLGNGAALLADDDGKGHSATKISVVRSSMPSGDLPISIALEKDIPLAPGDRIIVKKAPAVRVSLLGPGMQTSGVFDFALRPTLSEVLGRGAGLNPNAANDRAVFVLREKDGQKPLLFDFAWDKGEGVVASHRFAMQSGDLVYVAEAPIMSVQRVMNILFQAAVPAQLAK